MEKEREREGEKVGAIQVTQDIFTISIEALSSKSMMRWGVGDGVVELCLCVLWGVVKG